MVIRLQPPSGPGLPAPDWGFDDAWRETSFFDDPDLRRILDAPYYEDFIQRAASPKALGSIEGGPTLAQAWDILHPDPRKWTTYEQPRALTAPVLGDLRAGPTNDASRKLGNFNLNSINMFESLREGVTQGLGQQQASQYEPFSIDVEDTVFGDLHTTPMDVLNWSAELPVKLIERPLAFLQVAANRILGTPITLDDEGSAVYPFQKDPFYWEWLRQASDEQVTQFAQAQAGKYLSPGRNQQLFDALLARFKADKDSITGLSSGSLEIDWHAKKALSSAGGPAFGSYNYLNLTSPNPVGASLGAFAGSVPFIGIQLQNWLDPVTPEEEARWQALSVDERRWWLEAQGYTLIGKNLIAAVPLFNGANTLALAAKASSVPTIAKMGQTWDVTLKSANILMATGLAFTTAAWAAEIQAFSPELAEFGREINLAAPLSSDPNAALIISNIGGVASGTFGAALLVRSSAAAARWAAGMSPTRLNLSQRLWGTYELPFATEGFGGSPYRDLLQRAASVPLNESHLAETQALLSYLINASERDRLAVFSALEKGLATHPALDSLSIADRQAWVAGELARTYSSRRTRVAMMLDRFERFRRQLPLLPSTDDIAVEGATKLGVRNLVDAATRDFVTTYGPNFFGADVRSLRAGVRQGLQELGREPDMAAFDQLLGTKDNPQTAGAWLKMARLVHQLGYVTENGKLTEAIKADPGSAETGLALFSQRTPFRDEMESALVILRAEDRAAAKAYARELITRKTALGELYGAGEFRDAERAVADPDPEKLADHIQDVLEQGGWPERRIQASDPLTVDLPLNRYHAALAARGKWELGFRAKRPIAAAETLSAALDRLLSPIEFANLEPARVLLVDTVPADYIELLPGQRFRRTNWYALEPIMTSDGRFFVRNDPILGAPATDLVATAATRATNDPANPQPLDPYISPKAAEEFNLLPDRQKTLAYSVERTMGTYRSAPAEYELEFTGDVKQGRNAGANWPVLEQKIHGITLRWLFKAGRTGGEDLASLSPSRRLAGPTATKLFTYLGLRTADEIPFEWTGIKGTIQPLIDVDQVVDLRNPGQYTREVQAELVKHHIVDWLTGQHDSNADSFLIGLDGYVYGIDKGQAYKYFDDPEPGAAMTLPSSFWDYRTADAADVHLGEFLLAAIQKGQLAVTWEDVAPLLDEIAALPEDVYLAALSPLAAARELSGRFASVEQFFAEAIKRKRELPKAVANAFSYRGLATLPVTKGEAPRWAPGARGQLDIGTPVRLNERPVDTLTNHVDVAEPEPPPTLDHYKAGAVITEPDGGLWLIHPKPQAKLGGAAAAPAWTWPKGKVAEGEGFQAAAIREVFEETGLSIVIKEHLVDLPNEQGNVTRYYLAERVGGGPEFVATPDEIGLIGLIPEREVPGHLFRQSRSDARDGAVLDALRQRRAQGQEQAAAGGAAAGGAGEGDPTFAIPDADPAAEYGYVGHVRLRNGELWRTPWFDPGIVDAGAIDLGRRGLLGRAYDAVFRGWRSWRLMEQHRLNLHHRLTRDYDITPGQIDQFQGELIALSRKYRGVSIQALAGIPEEYPILGRMQTDMKEAAAAIFGDGPFLNRRTGRYDELDWPRIVVNAYRQSIRMNVLAGVTSSIKSIPGLGPALILPVTDVVYPLFRYTLSFIFKPSERTESGVIGAMRGVQYSGDPFIDAQYVRAGFGAGTALLVEDRGYDLMLQGMTTFSSALGRRGRYGEDPFFFEPLQAGELARRVAEQYAPSEPFTPGVPRSTLADSLEGGGLELPDPVRYPDVYPDSVRHLLRDTGEVDANGNPILELSGGEQTRRVVADQRDRILGGHFQTALASPDAAGRLGVGFAVLRSLPPGTIERLADALPVMHTPTVRSGSNPFDRQLEHMQTAIDGGYPLFSGLLSSGHYDLALYETLAGRTVPQAEQATGSITATSIGTGEQAIGFADAKYGSMASAYDVRSGILVVLKPEKLRDSVTVDTDRITYSSNVEQVRDAMRTPAAVHAINRLIAQDMIVRWASGRPELTLLEYLQAHGPNVFQSTEPFEFAFLSGIGIDDIAAILLPKSEMAAWSRFVAKNAEAVPGLADLHIAPYSGAYGNTMWANALERGGLLDLGNLRPDDIAPLTAEEGLLSLPIDLLTSSALQQLRGGSRYTLDEITRAAREAGLTAITERSMVDQLDIEINRVRLALRTDQAYLSQYTYTPKKQGYGGDLTTRQESVRLREAELANLAELRRDWAAHNAADPDAPGFADELAALQVRLEAYNQTRTTGPYDYLKNIAYDPAAPAAGFTRVIDENTGEVLLERPVEPAEMGVEFGRAGALPEADLPFRIAEARALLEAYQSRVPQGFHPARNLVIGDISARAIDSAIDSAGFRSALRARAEAKLGVSLGEPVIRAYVRAPARRIAPAGPSAKGIDEIVITVQDGSGQPYGNLTLPELAELWQHHGYPAEFRAAAEAAGLDPRAIAALVNPADPTINAGFLLHGRGSTAEGRLYFYEPHQGAVSPSHMRGTFEPSPLGHDYIDLDAPFAYDVVFAHHFEPGQSSYIDLASGNGFYRDSIEVHATAAGTRVERTDRWGGTHWAYDLTPAPGGTLAGQIDEANPQGQSSIALRSEALRDMIGRAAGQTVRVTMKHVDDRLAWERLVLRGEAPETFVAVDPVNGAVLDRPAIARRINPGMEDVPIEVPPASFDEVTPEGRLSARVRDYLESLGPKGKRLAKELFVDPIPYKQRQMDRLVFKLMRDRFAPLLREEAPDVAVVFDELKVPKERWLDFLVHDRYLMDRWLQSGARSDWETLLEHGGQYLGDIDYRATRQSLDELYTSPGFEVLLETLRLNMRAAHDEAYQAHFFSPYRSTFERSINHPILGIYPASWAYKVAKEWIRFLFKNETLGFRLGMTPAMVIRQMADAQARAFAQESDVSLEEWYEKGPYRNSVFIFNLLMPGDWSSLPFPASRTIRDAVRGNVNLYDIFERNVAAIGAGRDIRLTLGAGDELLRTITGEIGSGPIFREAGVPAHPGWSLWGDQELPAPGGGAAPREVFIWR